MGLLRSWCMSWAYAAWMDGARSLARWTSKWEIRRVQFWSSFMGTHYYAKALDWLKPCAGHNNFHLSWPYLLFHILQKIEDTCISTRYHIHVSSSYHVCFLLPCSFRRHCRCCSSRKHTLKLLRFATGCWSSRLPKSEASDTRGYEPGDSRNYWVLLVKVSIVCLKLL